MSTELNNFEIGNARADAIIRRIKAVENLKTDAQVAAIIKVEKGTIGTWKQRGAIPLEKLADYARFNGVSLEWLVNGMGTPLVKDIIAEPGAIYEVSTNQDVIYDIAADVVAYLQTNDIKLPREKIYNIVKLLHRDAIATGDTEVPQSRIKEIIELAI